MCIYDYAEKTAVVKSVIGAVLSSNPLSAFKEAKPIRTEKYPCVQPGKTFPINNNIRKTPCIIKLRVWRVWRE